MKLIYISPLRYPSEKAGSAFSMKSCEAFARQGVSVELWAPRRFNKLRREDPYKYYGVRHNFRLVKLPVVDLMPWLPAYFLMAASFAVSVLGYALWRRMQSAVFYSHEEFALFLLALISRRTVYEIHDFPSRRFFYNWLLKRVFAIVTTNTWKKNKLAEVFGSAPEKILAIPNAVDVGQFSSAMSRDGARAKLELPLEKKIVLYTGHLYAWKGADTLAEASRMLADDIWVYLVGGAENDIAEYRRRYHHYPRLKIAGYRPHAEIPLWLRAADVLVIPNTAREEISKYYTSPMKLFEYMVSGTPIVASNLPSIREIVSEREVKFFEPDNPAALTSSIKECLTQEAEAKNRAALSRKLVERYSWEARAAAVLEFLGMALGNKFR